MDNSKLIIVVYTGGACGDLISSIIDSTGVEFNNRAMSLPADRQRLKKPHLFVDCKEKDDYIQTIKDRYKSIPSHDLQYHQSKNHSFISINVDNMDSALWASNRFKSLHRPEVWEEMSRYCGASSVDEYAQMMIDFSNMVAPLSTYSIKLSSIREGNAVSELSRLGISIESKSREIYQRWLKLQDL